jgi:hypothetical protein
LCQGNFADYADYRFESSMVHKNVHLHSAGSNTHDRVEKSPASDGKISFLHFAQTEDICLKSSIGGKEGV